MNMLEDNFADIIGKAQQGLRLTDDQLAKRAGISVAALRRVRAGEFDETAVRRLAKALHLAADALVAIGRQAWRPRPHQVPGLACFESPVGDMMVNAYLIWDCAARVAAVFDTGTDAPAIVGFAQREGLEIREIFLTHGHSDHVADLERLLQATGATAHCTELEPVGGAVPFTPGATFALGTLTIATRLSSGHTRGGAIYVISGLERPVAVVGDALFAGSMGSGLYSYAEALRTNREQILSLPDDTVLCCGHGPLTSVGEEKQHNPFFAVGV